MSYSEFIQKLSRSPLIIIELGFDTAITPTGIEYLCDGIVPHGQMFWPCVEGIEWLPTRASENGGLGHPGEVVIKCRNFSWPSGPGTYFGRLLASNPYYLNRTIKIHVGYFKKGDSFSLSNFQERRYFLKKITGPDHRGLVKIEASDVLSKLADSTVPAISNGNLASFLSDVATGTINIQDNDGFSSGYAVIDDELVSYSGVSSSDSIVITGRAQGGTEAKEHDADAPVRHVYYYSGNCVDCVRDIIENYTEIDHSSYIPDTDWNEERDTFLSSENVEIWLLEPTDADEVVNKIGEQTYTNFWWQDDEQEIKCRAIGPTLTSDESWNDNENILDQKVIIKRDQRKIITQVWVYYGLIDKSKGASASNFESIHIAYDAGAELALGEPRIKKIFADYLPANASATASKIASRIISQNRRPLEITLSVDAKDSAIKVGQPVDLDTSLLEGSGGMNEVTKLRVIEKAQAENNRYVYKMVYSGVEQGNQYSVIAPNDVPDYDSASSEEKLKYGWLADSSDFVGAADDDPFLII